MGMMHHGDRTITVEKSHLIEKVKENKSNHEKEYAAAVIAYREAAKKELQKLQRELKNSDGNVELKLKLERPRNNVENYDRILKMFEWEVNDNVELTQSEFKEYVLDDNDFARAAKISNSFYLGN